MNSKHSTTQGCRGRSDDGDIRQEEHQELFKANAVKDNPQRAATKNAGFIQKPELQGKHVDFEDNGPKLAIKNLKNTPASSTDVVVDIAPPMELNHFKKKGRVTKSVSSVNGDGAQEIAPQKPRMRNATMVEDKSAGTYRLYEHEAPVTTQQRIGTLVMGVELWPDIFNFVSIVDQPRSGASNGGTTKVNHLNGFPVMVDYPTVSANESPRPESPEFAAFATCTNYKPKPQLSPEEEGEEVHVTVVSIPLEPMQDKSCPVPRFSVTSYSSANSASKAKVTFKERLRNMWRDFIERVSGRFSRFMSFMQDCNAGN